MTQKIRMDDQGVTFGGAFIPFRMMTGMRYREYTSRVAVLIFAMFAVVGVAALVATPSLQNETPLTKKIEAARYSIAGACGIVCVVCLFAPKRSSIVVQVLPNIERTIPASSPGGAAKIMAALRERGIPVEKEGFWFIFWW